MFLSIFVAVVNYVEIHPSCRLFSVATGCSPTSTLTSVYRWCGENLCEESSQGRQGNIQFFWNWTFFHVSLPMLPHAYCEWEIKQSRATSSQSTTMGGKNRTVVKVNCRWQKTCSRQPVQSAEKIEPPSRELPRVKKKRAAASAVGTQSAGKHQKLPPIAKRNVKLTKLSSFYCLQTDPKRLKKDLPKILKTLKPEDRVLVVGTSRMPFGILQLYCVLKIGINSGFWETAHLPLP